MKTFKQIQKEKLPGDYEIIAKAIEQSPETVKSKVAERRDDNEDLVRSAFSILLEDRKQSNELIILKIRRQLKLKTK